MKYCTRVLLSLPRQRDLSIGIGNQPNLEVLRKQLEYVKGTVQNYLSSQQLLRINSNQQQKQQNTKPVPREKLAQLWQENKKKAIEIINNDGNWPERINPVVDKNKTEEFYTNKYNIVRHELKPILNEYEDDHDEIPEFMPDEVERVVRKTPRGKKWGKDGVRYEDYKKKPSETNVEVSKVLNVVKKFKKAPRGWKHALIRRNPKKNYKPEDLTTLRDISLLPTIYKIFAKCLCNRILPNVVGSAINFWQRAYIKKRDRQELIFLMQTAIDDFKHISSRFYAIFVDFRDAFGSLDQGYLIRALLESGVHQLYCELIADIYEDSHFEVICEQHLSKEFPLPVGTKTGDPLSAVLFIIVLDKSLKEVHQLAIIHQNIQDEKRISPLPVLGYADDIAFVNHSENVIKLMLENLIEKTQDTGLRIRPDKCAIFYERRSANRWYKSKSDKPPCIEIGGQQITVRARYEPFTYLGKPVTVAGEPKDLIRNIIDEYSEILDKIAASVLPLALKIEALGIIALSKIEHYFPNVNFTEENLAELDKVLTACLRKMFNIYTNTTVRTMFMKKQYGGIGIRKPSTVYRATRISFLVNMLNHEDDNIRYVARNSLSLDFNKRGAKRSIQDNNFLGFNTTASGNLETHVKGGFGVQSRRETALGKN